MKHLSRFQASRVADFVRVNSDRIKNSDLIADSILRFADEEGMIHHFVVSDTVGSEWMREIESNCVMYWELERA
jgi:hypothetical protein